MTHRNWRFVFPCYLWTIIMSMVGVFLGHFVYKSRSWKWIDGVLTCVGGTDNNGNTLIWGSPDAQTLGWVQFYSSEENRNLDNLRVHENVHIVQAFVGSLVGVAFVPVIFALFGWSPLLGLVLGGFIGGLGFSLLYGILFLYFLVKLGGKDWIPAYFANPFEKQAYSIQDAYVTEPNTTVWGALNA